MSPKRSGAEVWLLRLYRELLQRQPSGTELEDWVAALAAGLSRQEVRDIFLDSDEYRDVAAFETRKNAVMASGLFDRVWYVANNRDVATARLDPLEHYCRRGCFEFRAPNAYFDEVWYREQTGIAADTVALLDYATRGEKLDQAPGPLFDPVWYRVAYALDAATSPLAHFLSHRASRTVAPNSSLWSLAYSDGGEDVAEGDDPFLRHLVADPDATQAIEREIRLIRDSGLFDENHYQLANEDVLNAGIDPVEHYCKFGWQEGRGPNFYFNPKWYIESNPEVARLRVNPLLHYLLVGEQADRRPVIYFEPGWYRRTYELPVNVSPLAHYLAHRRSQQFSPNSLFDPAWYLAQVKLQRRRDPFAHYLVAGMHQDLQPSPRFNAVAWRRGTTGRPSRHFRVGQYPERDNPLVNYLLTTYR